MRNAVANQLRRNLFDDLGEPRQRFRPEGDAVSDECHAVTHSGDRLTFELLPALKPPEGHPRMTEYGNEREPNICPKPPSILGFITSAKDFLRNRLFAWTELSFRESTFKLLITPVVHLLLS